MDDWAWITLLFSGASLLTGALAGWYIKIAKTRRGLRKDDFNHVVDKIHDLADERAREVKELREQLRSMSRQLDRQRTEMSAQSQELERHKIRIDRIRTKLVNSIAFNKGVLVICGGNSIILRVSPEVTPLFHWLPEEIEGKPISVLIPKRLQRRHYEAVKRALKGEGSLTDEVKRLDSTAVRKDGVEIEVSIFISWFMSEPGGYLMSAMIYPMISDDDSNSPKLDKTDEGPLMPAI